MKKVVASLVALACVAPSAMAGTVDFGGPYTALPGDMIQMPLIVTDALGGAPFMTFDLMIGSDTVALTPGLPGSWEYSPEVLSLVHPAIPVLYPTAAVFYPHGLTGIGALFLLGTGAAPFPLGVLTVDTTGLAPGDHLLYVGDDTGDGQGDPQGRDGGFSKVFTGAMFESISGTGVIHILVVCVADDDCDDGLFCNGTETCDVATGICQPDTPVDCDDGIVCTTDTCEAGVCVHIPRPAGIRCGEDGLFCTVNRCDGDGTCVTTSPCTEAPNLTCCESWRLCIDDSQTRCPRLRKKYAR